MASGSSSEQMATIQVGALNAVCRQFADSDKKNFEAQSDVFEAKSDRDR